MVFLMFNCPNIFSCGSLNWLFLSNSPCLLNLLFLSSISLLFKMLFNSLIVVIFCILIFIKRPTTFSQSLLQLVVVFWIFHYNHLWLVYPPFYIFQILPYFFPLLYFISRILFFKSFFKFFKIFK